MTDAWRRLEPLPETIEAIEALERGDDEPTMLAVLRRQARTVRELVPACVGLSVACLAGGVSVTLAASSEEIALLDGVQYLAGGPCVAAVDGERVLEVRHEEILDEHSWRLFAAATAAAGVASTLTLPILERGRVVGSVNLYAATPHAFDGHHQAIARLFSAWAPGAVRNADLAFRTREDARAAPDRVRRNATIETAVGILAASTGLDPHRARADLERAARRAGVDELDLARSVIEVVGRRDRPDG